MYEHNNKVEVFKVDDLNEYRDITSFSDTNNLEILKVGFEKIKTLEKFFEGFYNQLDLSFKVSYDYFKITDNHEKNVLLTNHLKIITIVMKNMCFYTWKVLKALSVLKY